jgi:hypothetical protein
LTLLMAVVAIGCGSSSKPVTVVPDPSLPIGLPAPSAPGEVNTYSGAQSPGAWVFTLDNSKNAFSYQPVTYPASPATGSIQSTAGFTQLGASGFAFEVLGRAAVLLPGSSAASPVFGVPQTQCYSITGKMRFQYIAMYPGPQTGVISQNNPDPLGYGSIVASTDTTGKNWQFENLQGNVVLGPASFAGTCSVSNGQASISMPSSTLLDAFWATTTITGTLVGPQLINAASEIPATTQSNIWIGPSGFFTADQSDPTQVPFAGASVAGMAEPSAPLTTSAVAAGQYLGFLYESPSYSSTGYPATPAFTTPVGFGQAVAGSGSTMTGGTYPNNNLNNNPNTDIQISLGAQDSTLNGLYTSATVTVLDPAQNCANFNGSPNGYQTKATPGLNANGYTTCTFPATAIAGNPDGNYAIFVSSYNWAANLGGVPMQIYLFQQQ